MLYTGYLPVGFSWLGALSSPDCSSVLAGQAYCSREDLGAGAGWSAVTAFRAVALGTYQLLGGSSTIGAFDPDPGGNLAALAITVVTSTSGVDLSIDAAGPDQAAVGADFTLAWNVRNHGATAAPGGSIVRITLPAGISFRSGSADNGPACTYAAPVATCVVTPGLATGAVESGTLTLRPTTPGAKAIGLGVEPADGLPANNTTTVSVTAL